MIAGEKNHLMTGNEAIACGAIDGGLDLATGYPGTPSTEIIEVLEKIKGNHQTYWHANEKTALGMALGCALHGNARAMVTMKHAGLNVAADPLKCIAISGNMGAVILAVGDDRGIHSSQNEFDSRNYAAELGLVVLEPADSQEAYDMTREGFALSFQSGNVVMLRTTTRVAHSRSFVVRRKKTPRLSLQPLVHNPKKYVVAPMYAAPNARRLYDVEVGRRRKILESHPLNYVEGPPTAEFGLVCSGIAYQIVKEVLPPDSVRFLKLGAPLPLPIERVREFAGTVKKLVAIEDGYTLREQLLINGFSLYGVKEYPKHSEFTPLVAHNLLVRLGLLKGPERKSTPIKTTRRPPAMCSGCPHRTMSYAVKMRGGPLIGDVGCYTLSSIPPLNIMSTAMDMGASIPMAEGSYHMDPSRKPVCMIGDGTFLHSGVQGLISAVDNRANITVLIMDNGTVAMTGQQQIASSTNHTVDFVKLVEGVGVKDVNMVDAHNMDQCTQALQNAEHVVGVSVIIVRGACIFIHPKYREDRKTGDRFKVNADACTLCGQCLEIGCPSISVSDDTGKAFIDDSCIGCGDCIQVCNPCPVQTNVQRYTMAFERGHPEEAAAVVRKTNPFGFACGKVCKAHCRTSAIVPSEGPSKGKPLEHAKMFPDFEAAASEGASQWTPKMEASSGKRALVLGAGPAGLTAARLMAMEGVEVDIFEASSEAGGLMYNGIPDENLDKAHVQRDVQAILDLDRITVHFGKTVDDNHSLSSLASDYDAVLIATGGTTVRELATREQLPMRDDGLIVDEQQRVTGRIFAAGDVIQGFGWDLSRAIGSGKRAAEQIMDCINVFTPLVTQPAIDERELDVILPEDFDLLHDSCDIFLGSVGGQGGVTATRILANLFLNEGWHCKTSEIHGVAQKGGVVTGNVRGSRAPIHAPLIIDGEADVGLFLEPLEALRWGHMIAKGAILIINRQSLVPPITTTGLGESYPTDPVSDIHLMRPDLKLIAVDTSHHVKDRFTGNVFLLGLLSTLLPFSVSSWKRVMEKALPSRYLAANEEAFIAGRAWVAQGARQPKARA